MRKHKRLAATIISMVVTFVMTFGSAGIVYAGNIDDPVIWTCFNISAVDNGAEKSTTITLDDTYLITSITTYHWNDGKGVKPGKIGIKQNGKKVGVWSAEGREGSGAKNVNWDIFPDIVLEAGDYDVLDSDPDTWSQNFESAGLGFVEVRGVPAEGSQTKVTGSSKKKDTKTGKDSKTDNKTKKTGTSGKSSKTKDTAAKKNSNKTQNNNTSKKGSASKKNGKTTKDSTSQKTGTAKGKTGSLKLEPDPNDIQWFIDFSESEGESVGSKKGTYTEKDDFAGKWKAYFIMLDDDGLLVEGDEHWCMTADVEVKGDNVTCTLHPDYVYNMKTKKKTDMTGGAGYKCKGKWSDGGTFDLTGDNGNLYLLGAIDLEDEQIALGTFMFPSGEYAYVGLRR